jgi:TusA-related sulfurtransferase
MTYVKTRIALDRLAPGEQLEVWLREGEPLENVPRSAEEDGHRVVCCEPMPGEPQGSWRLVLERGGAALGEII